MIKPNEEKPSNMTHVVIVGGGFAGVQCARTLARNPEVRVTLLDKNNYQQFQPLLYQVATAVLAPSNVAFNVRATLRSHPNINVKMTEVVNVDLGTRAVRTAQMAQEFPPILSSGREDSRLVRYQKTWE